MNRRKRNSNICVTIANQRSGTKLLGNCFNKGTEILSLGELFHDQSISPLSFKSFLQRHSYGRREHSVMQTFELFDVFFIELQSLYKNVHFDLMYGNLCFGSPLWWDQPDLLPILEYMKSREFAVIHLQRNIRDSYVSLINANVLQTFHQTQEGAILPGKLESPQCKDVTELALDFKYYLKNTRSFARRVSESIADYSYTCDVIYEEMMIAGGGFLSPQSRMKIANAVGNGCEEIGLQVAPTDLVASQRHGIYQLLKDRLELLGISEGGVGGF